MEEPMFTITIDMDKKCKKCGDPGSRPSGYCLKCHGKIVLALLKQEKKGVAR